MQLVKRRTISVQVVGADLLTFEAIFGVRTNRARVRAAVGLASCVTASQRGMDAARQRLGRRTDRQRSDALFQARRRGESVTDRR